MKYSYKYVSIRQLTTNVYVITEQCIFIVKEKPILSSLVSYEDKSNKTETLTFNLTYFISNN